LIRGIRAGEQEAAQRFVRQFEQVIRRQVRIHLTDPKLCRLFDSEDVCQMIFASFFVRAAAGQYDLERPEQLLKLLATMARNKVANRVECERAARRDQRRVVGVEAKELLAPGSSPSKQVAAKELLQKARQRLSPRE